MKFSTSIIITLLSVVTLAAEFVLYLFFGIGAAFSKDPNALSGVAGFFVGLMVLTAVAGIAAPISSLVELGVKKKNSGVYTFLSLLGLTVIALIFSASSAKKQESTEVASTTSGKDVDSPPSTGSLANEPTDKLEDAYRSKVLVKNVTTGKTVLEEDGVFGEVKNTGKRTLKELEITVYALDKDGNPVWDKKFYPVLDSKFAFGDSADPLKPNYSRKFGYKVEAPSDWDKEVSVKVTKVEFSADSASVDTSVEEDVSVKPDDIESGAKTNEVEAPKNANAADGSGKKDAALWQGERFPETRLRYLSESDISGWAVEAVRYALNEIYARHGLTFKSKAFKGQFNKFAWYHPVKSRSQAEVEALMSPIEKANKILLTVKRDELSGAGMARDG